MSNGLGQPGALSSDHVHPVCNIGLTGDLNPTRPFSEQVERT